MSHKSDTQSAMKGFTVIIKPLVHRASVTTLATKGERQKLRYGKDSGLPNSRSKHLKHGGGLTGINKTIKTKESRKMEGNTNANTKESMVSKREAQDGEAANKGDEGGRGKSIVNNTSTPTMRPASKYLRTRKARETVQDHKTR